jgi:hypothetical protein
MNVHLDIDALVLEGFPAEAHERIRQAVQNGLALLFSEQGVPPGLLSGGAVPRLDGGSFNRAPGVGPEVTGMQVARAIFYSLGGQPSDKSQGQEQPR